MTIPALTHPGWNDTFAQTDDWSKASFYNMFLSAVAERVMASGVWGVTVWTGPDGYKDPVQTVTLYSAGPPPVPATDVQAVYGNVDDPAPPFTGTQIFNYQTVAEMQGWLSRILGGGWPDVVYPGFADPSFTGWPAAPGTWTYSTEGAWLNPPNGLYLTRASLAAKIGLSNGLWRRKTFRKIFFQTGITRCNQWCAYFGAGIYAGWHFQQDAADAVVGMKAELYDVGSAVGPTATDNITNLSGGPCPGSYRGVYTYQGGGTWTFAGPYAVADLLDSEATGTGWSVAAGQMQHGDLFGPWIWTNLRDACNQMYLTVSTVLAGEPNGEYFANVVYKAGSGSTQAAALAAFNASTPATYYIAPFAVSAISSDGSSNDLILSYGQIQAPNVYLGRACTLHSYILSAANGVSSGTNVYDGEGVAPAADATWDLVDSKAFAAGSPAYGTRSSNVWPPATLVPSWGSAGQVRGFGVDNVLWTIDWRAGFNYKAA